MSPQFSVIVATYNRPELLRQALGSITAQTISDFECIVVDDGSQTARDVMPEDDRFRLVELVENGGLAHAWNTGVSEAVGDAVTFLDDDDLWTPQRLEYAERGLRAAEIATCGARWAHEDRSSPPRPLNGNVHDTVLDAFTPNMGRTAIVRTAKLPFDDTYAASQDVEWWIRQSAVSEVATIGDVGHISRRHDGVRHGNGTRARIAASERMLRDHGDYFAAHPRARAFRLYRMGMFHLDLGNRSDGRRCLTASLRCAPTRRAAWALAGSLRPSRPAVAPAP